MFYAGFGDLVPLQNEGMLNNNIGYAIFTIIFILTGLVTLASTMNLLVLRLATINAEEQVKLEAEAAEAKRQVVHLEGDVISGPNGRLLVSQEKPEQYDAVSVCSCTCLDHRLLKKKKKEKSNGREKDDRSIAFYTSNELSKRYCMDCSCKKASYSTEGSLSADANNCVLNT